MKTALFGVLALLICAPPAYSQGPTLSPQKAAEVKRGRQMVIAGAVLAVGGLAVLPITARETDQNGAALTASMGMVGAGAGVAWFGARKMRNGSRPSTTFGMTAGTTKSLFLRRAW